MLNSLLKECNALIRLAKFQESDSLNVLRRGFDLYSVECENVFIADEFNIKIKHQIPTFKTNIKRQTPTFNTNIKHQHWTVS